MRDPEKLRAKYARYNASEKGRAREAKRAMTLKRALYLVKLHAAQRETK